MRLAQKRRRIYEMCVFAMLAAIMFISKLLMEALPNIHLIGMLTIVYTLVFGWRALIPLYLYVMLNGVYAGFDLWWMPYLYIWTILWAVTMPLRRIPPKIGAFVLPVVCALHGLAYGTLYAPAQALLFGFDFAQTLAWIAAGLPFDLIHMASNLVAGLLILPLQKLLVTLMRRIPS